ncbi:LD-carboxypeptidase [Desulfococcaceae bacterium HSG8]|nr:LD-carboxypeptidase [Desulfococcaceae bacterium HSG8]
MDNKKTVIPTRLIPGDTIGVVAPAGSFGMKAFYLGVSILKSMGFRISVSGDIFKKKGYLAGSDTHRAGVVNRLFADRTVKAVFCARGGFGSIRILPLLDFECIRENPKIFVGFSDISAILSVLYAKCGLATFHGPLVTSLADTDQETKTSMLSALSSGKQLKIRPAKGITIRAGNASGPVSGGNLNTLCHLIGTPFEPVYNGHILLLEDRGEPAYKIDRMLTQMKLAGCFDGLAGLALGSFKDCSISEDIFRIADNIFKKNPVPILAGFDAGHGARNITIPMGLKATLDADNHLLSYHKPATVPIS